MVEPKDPKAKPPKEQEKESQTPSPEEGELTENELDLVAGGDSGEERPGGGR